MTPRETSHPIDVAVIAPAAHLEDLAVRGSIHMALTHLVLADNGDNPYTRFYAAQAAEGRTILLDNSAYELEHLTGAGLQADAVLTAARLIHATGVVCTDVLYDGPGTLAATRCFLSHTTTAGIQQTGFIGVPQGKDRAEWLACYHQFIAMPEIAVIGLSKLSVPRCWPSRADEPVTTARLTCVAELHRGGPPPKPLHLLGGDRSLPYELNQHRHLGHRGVRSNDSSTAVWYAAQDLPLDPATGRAPRHVPTKPDLEHTKLTGTHLATAYANIAVLRAHAGLPATDRPEGEPADGRR